MPPGAGLRTSVEMALALRATPSVILASHTVIPAKAASLCRGAVFGAMTEAPSSDMPQANSRIHRGKGIETTWYVVYFINGVLEGISA